MGTLEKLSLKSPATQVEKLFNYNFSLRGQRGHRRGREVLVRGDGAWEVDDGDGLEAVHDGDGHDDVQSWLQHDLPPRDGERPQPWKRF